MGTIPFGGTLTPIGGGMDGGYQLIRGRDVDVSSSLETTSFADGGGGTTLVTLNDHRFTDDDVVIFKDYTDDNGYYTGSFQIDYVDADSFKIDKAYASQTSQHIRVSPPAVGVLNSDDLFITDIGGTSNQSTSRYIAASTMADYMHTRPVPDDTNFYFGANNDFSFKFENSSNVFKLYNGSDEVFSISSSTGVITLPALGSAPSATLGGLYFDGTDFFAGVDV